jgi:hypothetical protein
MGRREGRGREAANLLTGDEDELCRSRQLGVFGNKKNGMHTVHCDHVSSSKYQKVRMQTATSIVPSYHVEADL